MPSELEKTLVLVVGAGASSEVNLPVGSQLKDRIAQALNITFDYGNQMQSGDEYIMRALHIAATNDRVQTGVIGPYLEACWMIRDAMPQASSIDNFIDAHRENKRIEKCGKLAIARCILDAESNSALRVDRSNIYNKINFKSIETTWFNLFFRLLVDGCQRSDLSQRFSRTAIITFNYDRCIEHFFHASLQNYYGLSSQDAADVMSNLSIYHPYGSIGLLPWQKGATSGGIEFGCAPNSQLLLKISEQLKTFTEGTDETHSDIIAIRETMRSAARVAFLGFAFNPQNLKLLYGEEDSSIPSRQCPVYGSAFGLSKSDVQVISSLLANLGRYPFDQIHLERELRCANLVQEYMRSLSVH